MKNDQCQIKNGNEKHQVKFIMPDIGATRSRQQAAQLVVDQSVFRRDLPTDIKPENLNTI